MGAWVTHVLLYKFHISKEPGGGREGSRLLYHLWPDSANTAAPKEGAASRPAPPATQDGMTPLHWAAHRGHQDVAVMLLERGARTEAKTRVSAPKRGCGWRAGEGGGKRSLPALVQQSSFAASFRPPAHTPRLPPQLRGRLAV